MTASRKGLSPLTVLRIDGPLDLEAVAKLIDEPWVTVVNHCLHLEDYGLAVGRADGTWDVTAEGRLLFESQMCVRRDEARACVGRAS